MYVGSLLEQLNQISAPHNGSRKLVSVCTKINPTARAYRDTSSSWQVPRSTHNSACEYVYVPFLRAEQPDHASATEDTALSSVK